MSSSWLARCARQWTQLYVRWHSDGRYAWKVFTISSPRRVVTWPGHVFSQLACSLTDRYDDSRHAEAVSSRGDASLFATRTWWCAAAGWTDSDQRQPEDDEDQSSLTTHRHTRRADQQTERQPGSAKQRTAQQRERERQSLAAQAIDSASHRGAPCHAAAAAGRL